MKRTISVAVLALAVVATSYAQTNIESSTKEFSRRGTREVYGFAHATTIFNIFESDAGVFGGGVGVGYNFAQHFTLNGELSLSAAEFSGGVFNWAGDESTTLFMAHVYADWNILKYRVTPVISAGLGIGAFSNGTGAAFDQTIGLGVRWDAGDRLVFKAMLRTGAMETSNSHLGNNSDGWALFGFSAEVGYKF